MDSARDERRARLRKLFEQLEVDIRSAIDEYNKATSYVAVTMAIESQKINAADFVDEEFDYVVVEFKSGVTWLIRLVLYGDGTPAFQFVRVETKNSDRRLEALSLTNDSVNLVMTAEDLIGVSLNDNMTDEAKRHVGTPLQQYANEKPSFRTISKRTIELIIRFQFLDASMSTVE